MKIFLPTINILNVDSELLEKYFFRKINEQYIYSEEGIIQIINSKLFKLNIVDEITSTVKLDKFDIIIDNSKFVIDSECFQIHPYHIDEFITKYIYKLRKNSIIDLVIEKNNDIIINFYFYLKDNTHIINIKEDILTFLFQLNLC